MGTNLWYENAKRRDYCTLQPYKKYILSYVLFVRPYDSAYFSCGP